MKKIFCLIIMLLIVPTFVNAATASTSFYCGNTIRDEEQKLVKECYVMLSADSSSKIYGLEAKYNLSNASFKSIEIVDKRLKVISKSDTGFKAVYENPVSGINDLKILKAVFYVESDNCVINLQPTGWESIPKCEKRNGYYYNQNGESVSEMEYKADCGKLSCENYNGKFYNKTGVAVTEAEYKADCGLYKCEKVADKYYNDKGVAVSEKEYNEVCKTYSCEAVDGKFYNKAGAAVTEAEYKADCGLYKCEKVADKYYNDKGVAVSEKEYNKACKKYSCEIVDEEYYSKNGVVVTKEEYEKECVVKETPKCKEVDGKYYGSLGSEVTKEVYESECPGKEVKTGVNTYSYISVGLLLTIGILYKVCKKKNYFN